MPSTGKWKLPDDEVPKVGWTQIAFYHSDSANFCDMCEEDHGQTNKHLMQHPAYPDILDCGTDCAKIMVQGSEVKDARNAIQKDRARYRRWQAADEAEVLALASQAAQSASVERVERLLDAAL